MTERYVKPGEGRRVRIPDENNAVMSNDGQFIADSVWLRRRLADGDLVEAEAPSPAAEKPAREERETPLEIDPLAV